MKNKDRRVAFLTYYLMLAGLVGLLVTFIDLRKPQSDFWYWFSMCTAGVLFLMCFYSGYLFLNKDEKKATEWGIIVHILQLISFTAWGWSYFFVTGLGLTVSYDFAIPGIEFAAGISDFEWSIVPKSTPQEFGFNIFAFIILIILVRIRKSYK